MNKTVSDMASTGLLFARKFLRVCKQSDDHCQEAYANEPFRAKVLKHLVRGNEMQHNPLQQVWRAAAKDRILRMVPNCRDANISCTTNAGPCQPLPFLGFHD